MFNKIKRLFEKVKKLFARVKDNIKYDNIPSIDTENPKTTSNDVVSPIFIGYNNPIKRMIENLSNSEFYTELFNEMRTIIAKTKPDTLFAYTTETGILIFESSNKNIFKDTGSIDFNYTISEYEDDNGDIRYVYNVSMKSILKNIKYIVDNIEDYYFLFNYMKTYIPDEFIQTYMATMPSVTKEELLHLKSLFSNLGDQSYESTIISRNIDIYLKTIDKDDTVMCVDFTCGEYNILPVDSIMVSLIMDKESYDILDICTDWKISTYPVLYFGESDEIVFVQIPISILYNYRNDINNASNSTEMKFNLDILLKYIGYTLL